MSIVSDLINDIKHGIIVHNVSLCSSLVSSARSSVTIAISVLTMHKNRKKRQEEVKHSETSVLVPMPIELST